MSELATTGLTADPLFVGATRPPMRWGVTYSALLFNMVFTMEVFLLTKNLLTLAAVRCPIHGICALLCARDARFFDLVLLWGRTRMPALLANLRFWKASSYSPLALDLPNRGAAARAASAAAALSTGRCVLSAARRQLRPRAHCGRATFPYARARRAARRAGRTSATTCRCFGSAGASFESADDEELNNWHERLNVLWRNIASPNVALWTHVIRRRAERRQLRSRPARRSGFRRRACSASTSERLASETLMVNELYLRRRLSARRRAGDRAWCRKAARESAARRARNWSSPMRSMPARSLRRRCGPRWRATSRKLLGVYRAGSIWCSSLLEYLALLINGEWQRVPLPRGPAQSRCWRPRGCSSAPRRSSTACRPARASARCWASRNTRRRAWSGCSTACSPRRSRSC